MADINTALAASKDAMNQLMVAGERTATAWAAPRAPGKWSPSQIVEHVARSLAESANMAAGRLTRRADANDHLPRRARRGLRALHGTAHAPSRQADGGLLAPGAHGV